MPLSARWAECLSGINQFLGGAAVQALRTLKNLAVQEPRSSVFCHALDERPADYGQPSSFFNEERQAATVGNQYDRHHI